MLNSFRAFSGGVTTKIMLALLILSFAMWGVGDMLRTGARNQAVATVGGKNISLENYHRELATESENVRHQLGASYSPELLKRLNVPQFVLQRMVQQSLLSQEAVRMGFIPDDVHVALSIRSNPAFMNHSDAFDKARFENMLRSRGMTEKNFVEELRMQMAMDKLLDALKVDLPLGEPMLVRLQTALNEGRMVSAYKITPAATNEAAPAEAELAAFHQKHAELFTAPEVRSVSFVRFSAKDAEAKVLTLSDAAIRDYYLSHEEQFRTPEKREVEQLIYSSEDKAREAYEEVKLGKPFSDIAAATSPLNKNALSLGMVDKKGIIEDAAEKVFALKTGGYTEPVKSAFGYHIFRVAKIEPVGIEPLEEARDVIVQSLKQATVENALTDKINQLEDALAGGSTLAEAAKSMGLKLEQAGTFDKFGNTPQGSSNSEMPVLDKFLDVAFKTEEKTESSVISSKDGVYYVLRVESLTPETLRPLADVKNEVIKAYGQRQNERRAADLASLIEKDIAAKNPASAIIAAHGLTKTASGKIMRDSKAVSFVALPPSLVSQAFSLPVATLTTPVKDKQGEYLLLAVDGVAPSAGDKPNTAQLLKDLAEQMQEEMMTQYLRHLELYTPVVVNTAILDQLLKTSDATN